MSTEFYNWICCQIGARENYSIPRALHQEGKLAHLITDAWVSPESGFNLMPKSFLVNLRARYHSDLEKASVKSFNTSLIQFELTQKLQKNIGWQQVIARNKWFQKQAISTLTSIDNQLANPPILFAYSYAALELFRFAKKQGWYTILGQIDPGIEEEIILTQEYERYPQFSRNWQSAPSEYWQNWKKECQIADAIVVNSNWSRQLLEKTGVDSQKIYIIPLVYTPPEFADNFVRTYPKSFSQERPLRVLFLGQVILRKGIAALLNAVKLLEGYPVEFWIVGSQEIEIPTYFQTHAQIRWVGRVNRSETTQYYQMADVFLFPTLSDGFGLTQLEAQVWKLPIIASRCCGEVIVDGLNGWILQEISGVAIANIIKVCIDDPITIAALAKNSQTSNNYTLQTLAENLLKL